MTSSIATKTAVLDDFQHMDGRRLKAHPQTILKSAYVKRDENRVNIIELEFRT